MNLNVKAIVSAGLQPAEHIHADGYASDASQAVALAKALMNL